MSDSIKFKCIKCGELIEVAADKFEKPVPCPSCSYFSVPPKDVRPPSVPAQDVNTPSAPANHSHQNSGFDFRMLAGFIMTLGIIGLVYGFIQFSGNQKQQHVEPSPTPDHGGNLVAGMLDSQTRAIQAAEENMQIDRQNMVRTQAQDSAKKFMIAGAVVLFLGIGVAASARKKGE